MCFVVMIGATVAAAVYISQGVRRLNEDQDVLSETSSLRTTTPSPTPLQSTMTKTNTVTETSLVTGQITIIISGLQSTIYTIATAPPLPAINCQVGDTGEMCGGLFSQPGHSN